MHLKPEASVSLKVTKITFDRDSKFVHVVLARVLFKKPFKMENFVTILTFQCLLFVNPQVELQPKMVPFKVFITYVALGWFLVLNHMLPKGYQSSVVLATNFASYAICLSMSVH